MCRSRARSGASICSTKPERTMVSYSIRRASERLEVFQAAVVILVLDRRGDDARRRGIHEAFNKDIRMLFEDTCEVTAFFLDRCRIDIAHLSDGRRQALVGRHPCRARSLLDPPLLELGIAFDIRA